MIELAAIFFLTVSVTSVVSFGVYISYRLVVLSHEWINKKKSTWVPDKSKQNRRSTDEPTRIIPEGFWHTVRAWEMGEEA